MIFKPPLSASIQQLMQAKFTADVLKKSAVLFDFQRLIVGGILAYGHKIENIFILLTIEKMRY